VNWEGDLWGGKVADEEGGRQETQHFSDDVLVGSLEFYFEVDFVLVLGCDETCDETDEFHPKVLL
jgi:hypothetical protein